MVVSMLWDEGPRMTPGALRAKSQVRFTGSVWG